MTREQYLAKRQKLMNEAQALIDSGKLEDSAAKMKEIENLDNIGVAYPDGVGINFNKAGASATARQRSAQVSLAVILIRLAVPKAPSIISP